MSRTARLLGMLSCAVFATACASATATINSYVDPTYARGGIESIAVFPIRNGRFAPSEAQQINRRIATVIHARDPELRIMSTPEAISLLNEHGLADDWAVFLENYVASGVPDANALRDFGTALGVGAILQGEIVNVFQRDGEFGGDKGQTRVTVRFTILDCEHGRMLWEASSDGTKTTATTLDHAPPIVEAVGLAVDKILDNLPL